MKFETKAVRKLGGKQERHTVQVQLRGHDPVDVDVDIDVPGPQPVRNAVGLRLGTDDQWHYEYREVNGAWAPLSVPTGNGKWKNLPPAAEIERQKRLGLVRYHHLEIAEAIGPLGQFTLGGLRVKPLTPPFVDAETGHLTIHIEVKDASTDQPVDVGDGVFQFSNPNVDAERHDVKAWLKRELVKVIKVAHL